MVTYAAAILERGSIPRASTSFFVSNFLSFWEGEGLSSNFPERTRSDTSSVSS